MMLNFTCVGCGRCCHGLRLPLSIAEAILWIERGGTVEVMCDAAPRIDDEDPQARHRAARAIAGRSGGLPLRVSIQLVAVFDGPCPNLLPDMRCGAYHVRPDACRIYPAELRPGRAVVPQDKACPPESWGEGRPPFLDDTAGVRDLETAAAIARARAAGLDDLAAKARLAAMLGIDRAALVNEGLVIWRIASDDLLSALRRARAAAMVPAMEWSLVSAREETRAMIADAEAIAETPDALRAEARYLAFHD